MTVYLFSPLRHRWMLIFYFLLSVCVLLFIFQIKIPTNEFLQVVGTKGWLSPALRKASLRWNKDISAPLQTVACLPVKNIVFLKTHKSASSSVQNILMRYANKNGLTVALPAGRTSSLFSLVKPFQKEMATGVPWEILGFNILCHHMVFNGPVIQSFMPKDSIFISIVRDPVNLFESLYEYSGLEEFYKMDIEEYARSTKNTSLLKKLKFRSNGMGRNQMLYDFGVHPVYFSSPTKIKKAIQNLDNYFDFVMIAEYFDESIVILRHILCWDLDDVISLTINARMDTYRRNLSSEAINNLRVWNGGDKMLYEYFLNKFKLTVKEIGKTKLNYEVRELRKRREDWLNYCVEKKVESRNLTAFRIWSSKVAGYKIKSNMKNSTCEDLVKPENFFTAEIRQKQLLRSILKGAKVPTYGPKSLNQLLDYKYLNSHDQEIARKLVQSQYQHHRKRFSYLKEKMKVNKHV